MTTFYGIVPPLVTPLLSNDRLDIDGLEKLIEHVIEGGVHGLFILGTTGEAQSLSFEMRVEMIKETARILKNRLPLMVGISDTSLVDSIKLAEYAKQYNADAVVSAPPYYFATGQPELAEFYGELVKQSPLPLFLYNMPVHTKMNFSPSTIRQISQNPKVVGFKDSSANGTYLQSVIYEMRDHNDFSIFVGPEEMTAEAVLLGASGGVNGGANLFPRLYVDLYNAAHEGNLDEVSRLQKIVMQISSTIYTQGLYGSSYLKGLKCALGIKGICSDLPAVPFQKFEGEYVIRIKQALDEINF